MGWIHLTHIRTRCAFMHTVMIRGYQKKAREFPGHSASQEGLCFTELVTGQRASTNARLLGLFITLLVMRKNFLGLIRR